MRRIRQTIGVTLASFLALFALAPAVHSQGGDQADWPAVYHPALLPAFAGDMARHASAPRYALALTIAQDDAETYITGEARVTVTNRHAVPLDSLVFRLYPNLPSYGGEMNVRAATVDGAPVEPLLDNTRTVLTVPLPAPLAPGGGAQVGLTYSIGIVHERFRLYGQFGYLDGVLALPNAYPMLAVYQPGEGWWQVTAHPQGDVVFSETAFFDVRITAPADLIFAATGAEIDLVTNADGTLTHRYVAPLARDFSLAGSRRYVTLTSEQDGVLLRLFYDPEPDGAGEAAQRGMAIARAALATFGTLFGPYPFSELDVVQTPNAAGGLEYPGLIAINDDAWNTNAEYFEFLLVHEIAHQWWYSLVGNDQARHPWIDEALAQYAVAQYIRAVEGEAAYAAAIDSFRAQYENFAAEQGDAAIGLPTAAYVGQAYWALIYQKGPLFYAALEAEYGHDAVMAALRALFAAHCYGIVGPQDVLDALEASLDTELDAAFAEWVGGVAVG